MRKILTILFFLLAFEAYSQQGFKLILLDSKGRSDTVVFGMVNNATSGIDLAIGEVNIFGKTLDSLDLRSVQRDLSSHLCLNQSTYENAGEPLIFPENADLKRDFRRIAPFSPINNNFEFTINAVEYPLRVITDFTQANLFGPWGVWIGALDSGCEVIYTFEANRNKIDTIIVDNDKSIKSVMVKFSHDAGINVSSSRSAIALFPNPITDKLTIAIDKANTENALITIYTTTGNLVYTQKLNGQKSIDIITSTFRKGLYLLSYADPNGYRETTKIVIK